MKTYLFILFFAFSNFSHGKQESVSQKNRATSQCVENTAYFLKSIRWQKGPYYGQNKLGKCFISFTSDDDNSGMILFINSNESNYVGSIELDQVSEENWTGISTQVNKCVMTDSTLTIEAKFRMPSYLAMMSNGKAQKSWSIFDHVEKQSATLSKNANNKLVSATITTRQTGKQTCFFN